jgi:KTSC domain-containing protein
MNELRQAIATILELASQIINELDDELMMALAELINAASQRLSQIEQEPQGPTSLSSRNDLTPAMPSSNVEGFAYDDKTGRLLIRFLGKHPNRNGPIYGYSGVPPNIFEIFRRGAIPAKTDGKNKWGQWWRGKYPSIGAAMYHLIRAGNYPYARLS